MTIVDEYIINHQDVLNAAEMASKLGISVESVISRRSLLNRQVIKPTMHITIYDEIHALVQFINERRCGVWVEIAKEKVRQLDRAANQL